jgi:alpha-glucoside transport system substrate-binding protein
MNKLALKIHLLGQPRISQDGFPIGLPGNRPLALLAYLSVSPRAYSREHLIDLLFDRPNDPRAALRWTLSKLRKATGSDFILADMNEVSFNHQSDYWLDVSAFEAGENELYRGDFLEGLHLRGAPRFEDWLIFERQRLRGIYQASLEQQLNVYKQEDDHAATIITAQELLKLDHFREDWHYDLIYAYAKLGKRAAALEQYEMCNQLLREEMGVYPVTEIRALVETIQNEFNVANSTPKYSNIQSNNTTTDAGEQTEDLIASTEIRSRPGLSRSDWAVIGIIGLFVATFFILTRIFSDKGQMVFKNMMGSSTTNSASLHPATNTQLASKIVWIMAPFSDERAELFIQSLRHFEEQSGIDIEFITGNEKDFNKRLDTGVLPDIALFPQPGRLVNLAKQGKVIDLSTFLDNDYLHEQYPEIYLKLAILDGKILGAWYRAFLKSLVWYPKQAFEAKGYQVPKTWDDLIALSDQIVADGGVPWCIGINDNDVKGWVGTDWVEDILLRTAPPETYDAWVKHELPFDSPEMQRVFEIMGQIWLNEDYVYGGVDNILVENISESPSHLFEDPPGCFLHRQASFAPYFFPKGVHYAQDYDFFYLPPIDPEFGKPVLVSGDIFAMFNDRPEVREVMRYLTTAQSAKLMIEKGGFLSPYKATPIEWFPTVADLRYAQIILSADTYRFDGSDMMPEVVGFGSFFRGINDWVEGVNLETVLQEIDDSWPQ